MTADLIADVDLGALPTTDARVYYDVPEDAYRALPRLSYSGAKVLLDCPARYRYEQDHGRAPKREYDFGHVAHALLLGKGEQFAIGAFSDFKTKLAQQWRDAVRADGQVPILAEEHERALAVADAVRASKAGALFELGRAEVSLQWTDAESGVACKARLDWLAPNAIVDLKTCDSASPSAIAKASMNYRYDMQDAAYTDAVAACGLGDLPMVFVFVEKTPPHLVHPIVLDPPARELGARRWRDAIELYLSCTATGRWPGYADDITVISYPAYAYR